MAVHNKVICEIFQKLLDLRIQQGETYRAKAYEKVIPLLRTYHKEIESGLEARQIRGIGDNMARKIDEILQTGTLTELENPPGETDVPVDMEKQNVLKIFESIERVGHKTALKWYNLGYRKISDIPVSACNAGQWIGIQLHHELIQRIPRAEIEQFEQILHSQLDPIGIQFQICGSYRRGKPDSGDIDILVLSRPDISVITEILRCPVFTHTLAHGPKKFLGICKINKLHRRIDIEITPPQEYPYSLLYFTGPARFNVLMRERATQLGGNLNEKELTNTLGQRYPVTSEQEIFALMGIQYLTPEQRELYA